MKSNSSGDNADDSALDGHTVGDDTAGDNSSDDTERERRLTDAAWGQIASEKVLVELSSRGEARQFHREVEQIVGALRKGREQEELPEHSAELRDLVKERLKGTTSSARPTRRFLAAVVAIAASAVVAVLHFASQPSGNVLLRAPTLARQTVIDGSFDGESLANELTGKEITAKEISAKEISGEETSAEEISDNKMFGGRGAAGKPVATVDEDGNGLADDSRLDKLLTESQRGENASEQDSLGIAGTVPAQVELEELQENITAAQLAQELLNDRASAVEATKSTPIRGHSLLPDQITTIGATLDTAGAKRSPVGEAKKSEMLYRNAGRGVNAAQPPRGGGRLAESQRGRAVSDGVSNLSVVVPTDSYAMSPPRTRMERGREYGVDLRLELKATDQVRRQKLVEERLVQEGRETKNLSQEEYLPITENAFLSPLSHPLSTFGIDVDSGSYANVRRFLTSGSLPPPNAVRIEELVNYFRYDGPQPADETPFGVTLATASCPWQPGNQLVRIQLQAKDVQVEEKPSNLVFLLDVSGSMSDANKLPLLQQAMKLLASQLGEDDRVAIVTYAGEAGLCLEPTRGDKQEEIRAAIDSLKASGSTNGSAGIQLAYEQAARSFIGGGINRVVLATDGDLNVGVTANHELVELIREKAQSGVFLTVLGLGEGNLKDGKLEQLADNGNGIYAYLDSLREARKVLVEQLTGSLVTVAKDVKVKVEFNPAEVESYRLLGYENRLMSAAEFDDERKDSGDLGAGHSVTVLYEITPHGRPQAPQSGETLKYQHRPQPPVAKSDLTAAANNGELMTLSLRYKEPEGDESTLREFTLKAAANDFANASRDFRFSAAVAEFGMLLRGSEHCGDATWAQVEEIASSALGADTAGHRTEFLDLVRRAATAR